MTFTEDILRIEISKDNNMYEITIFYLYIDSYDKGNNLNQ